MTLFEFIIKKLTSRSEKEIMDVEIKTQTKEFHRRKGGSLYRIVSM